MVESMEMKTGFELSIAQIRILTVESETELAFLIICVRFSHRSLVIGFFKLCSTDSWGLL